MKNNKMIKIITIFILSTILVFLGFILYKNKKSESNNNNRFNIYFYNPGSKTIEVEERIIKKGTNEELLQSLLNEFLAGPKNGLLLKVMPDNVKMLQAKIGVDSDTLEVNFSKEYNNLLPVNEIVLRSALVWTMTELDFIKNVKINVENDEELIQLSNRQNILLNPEIPSSKTETLSSVLYFKDISTNKLKLEKRIINFDPDLSKEKFIVQELMVGPKDSSLEKLIPEEVKIRSITEEEGTCYVDFSSEFEIKMPQDKEQEKLVIYSIVNSLVELNHISKVQFLIESKKPQNYRGYLDLSMPLEQDLTIVSEPNSNSILD